MRTVVKQLAMVARESFGASTLLKEDAEPGEPFNAEEEQDIEEELQVECRLCTANEATPCSYIAYRRHVVHP